jgi:hypothetical protein
MVEQKRYGLRIYKDKEPCLEYTYYSLRQIYEKTTKYKNKKQLSDSIGLTIKQEFPEKFDHNSTYTAEIVFYPNKKATEGIAKKSEYGKFKSNGVTSTLLPILYKDNINVLNDKYIENRFFSLMTRENSAFRNRLFELYDSSVLDDKDKNGKQIDKPSYFLFRNLLDVINVFKTKGTQEELIISVKKLYNKISSGLAERTKIYVIMETEFPIKKRQEPIPKQTVMDDRIEVPFIIYLQLPKEEREKVKMGRMEEGDGPKLLKLALSGKLLPEDKTKSR